MCCVTTDNLKKINVKEADDKRLFLDAQNTCHVTEFIKQS